MTDRADERARIVANWRGVVFAALVPLYVIMRRTGFDRWQAELLQEDAHADLSDMKHRAAIERNDHNGEPK